MGVTVQCQCPKQSTRCSADNVPAQEVVDARTEIGDLQGGRGPWQRGREDSGRVECSQELFLEESRFKQGCQRENERVLVGDDGISECKRVDLAQRAESCSTTLDVVVVADKRREEQACECGQEGDIGGPRLPDRNDDLLHIGGHGFVKRSYHQQTGDQVTDNKGEGKEVQHGTRDPDVLCVGFGCCGREYQLQTGIYRHREAKCQGLSKEAEDYGAVRVQVFASAFHSLFFIVLLITIWDAHTTQ